MRVGIYLIGLVFTVGLVHGQESSGNPLADVQYIADELHDLFEGTFDNVRFYMTGLLKEQNTAVLEEIIFELNNWKFETRNTNLQIPTSGCSGCGCSNQLSGCGCGNCNLQNNAQRSEDNEEIDPETRQCGCGNCNLQTPTSGCSGCGCSNQVLGCGCGNCNLQNPTSGCTGCGCGSCGSVVNENQAGNCGQAEDLDENSAQPREDDEEIVNDPESRQCGCGNCNLQTPTSGCSGCGCSNQLSGCGCGNCNLQNPTSGCTGCGCGSCGSVVNENQAGNCGQAEDLDENRAQPREDDEEIVNDPESRQCGCGNCNLQTPTSGCSGCGCSNQLTGCGCGNCNLQNPTSGCTGCGCGSCGSVVNENQAGNCGQAEEIVNDPESRQCGCGNCNLQTPTSGCSGCGCSNQVLGCGCGNCNLQNPTSGCTGCGCGGCGSVVNENQAGNCGQAEDLDENSAQPRDDDEEIVNDPESRQCGCGSCNLQTPTSGCSGCGCSNQLSGCGCGNCNLQNPTSGCTGCGCGSCGSVVNENQAGNCGQAEEIVNDPESRQCGCGNCNLQTPTSGCSGCGCSNQVLGCGCGNCNLQNPTSGCTGCGCGSCGSVVNENQAGNCGQAEDLDENRAQPRENDEEIVNDPESRQCGCGSSNLQTPASGCSGCGCSNQLSGCGCGNCNLQNSAQRSEDNEEIVNDPESRQCGCGNCNLQTPTSGCSGCGCSNQVLGCGCGNCNLQNPTSGCTGCGCGSCGSVVNENQAGNCGQADEEIKADTRQCGCNRPRNCIVCACIDCPCANNNICGEPFGQIVEKIVQPLNTPELGEAIRQCALTAANTLDTRQRAVLTEIEKGTRISTDLQMTVSNALGDFNVLMYYFNFYDYMEIQIYHYYDMLQNELGPELVELIDEIEQNKDSLIQDLNTCMASAFTKFGNQN